MAHSPNSRNFGHLRYVAFSGLLSGDTDRRTHYRNEASLYRACANAYLQDAAPWATLKTNPQRAAASIGFALRLVQLSARLAWSIIPALSETVLALFGEGAGVPAWPQLTEDFLLAPIDVCHLGQLREPLVRKLSPADVARLSARFAGCHAGGCPPTVGYELLNEPAVEQLP